jgi:hypothetical protein
VPSPAERWRALGQLAAVLACIALAPVSDRVQAAPAPSANIAPGGPAATTHASLRSQVEAAVSGLRQDPNLGAERSIRVLRWVDRTHKPKQQSALLARLLHWLAEAFRWIASAGRALFIAAAVLLAALLAVYLVRAAANRRPAGPAMPAGRPAFVRGLDIRPQSLPEDIGAAALSLWRAGAARAALALLYRGLLSRAVHLHGIAIRDSSTEAECLRLCRGRLLPAAQNYAATLIGQWQLAVYRGALPTAAEVEALCSAFARALAAVPSDGPPRAGQHGAPA